MSSTPSSHSEDGESEASQNSITDPFDDPINKEETQSTHASQSDEENDFHSYNAEEEFEMQTENINATESHLEEPLTHETTHNENDASELGQIEETNPEPSEHRSPSPERNDDDDIRAYYDEQQRQYEEDDHDEDATEASSSTQSRTDSPAPNANILTHELIQRFTSSPLHHITILDLSSLGLISHSPEPLRTYALETLLLSHNKLPRLNCITSLNNLWKLDLRYNAISSLDFLYVERSCWKVLGSLLMGWNRLHDVTDLFSFLAVTQVLELQLQGNTFESRPATAHTTSPHSKKRSTSAASTSSSFKLTHDEITNLVYNICPYVWILDGIFITQQDRDRASQFFNNMHARSTQKDVTKQERRRIKSVLALREELFLIYNKERRRRTKRSYLPLGRRAREFLSLNLVTDSNHDTTSTSTPTVDDDYTKLRYLAVFHVENYLLERSLVVPEEIISDKSLPNGMESLNDTIHIRVSPVPSPQNIMPLGPPFHTALLYDLSKDDSARVQTFLRSSLLFRVNFRVECEIYHFLLRRGCPRYVQMSDSMKNVVLQELAQLAPYARLCLIQMINDKLLNVAPQRKVSTQFSIEEKYQLAHFLYRRVLNTSCYKEPQVMVEMSDLFDFIANIEQPNAEDVSPTPMLRSDSTTDRLASRMSIDSARIIPSGKQDKKKRVHIDRTPKYVLDNPEHSSSFYYSSVRVPRESELVLLHGQWTAVLETLRNGVVVLNIRNDRSEYLAVSKENMIWVPSGTRGGYWKVQDANKKPAYEPTPPTKSDLKLFAANDTWTSTFLVASKECIEKLNEKEGGRWSGITDRIPFKIFQVPDEFVIQPGKVDDAVDEEEWEPMPHGSPPRRPQETRSSTFMTEVGLSSRQPEREDIPEDMDSAGASPVSSRPTSRQSRHSTGKQLPRVTRSTGGSATTSPSSTGRSRKVNVSPRSAALLNTAPPSAHHSLSQTLGGMAVNVPNMLYDLSSRNHQLQATPHLRSKPAWNNIPGKSVFVVHNPLQLHPFSLPPAKKHRPIVTEPLVRYVKHDNLDATPPEPIIPEKPFRTRFAQYQRQVWNYHHKMRKGGSSMKTLKSTKTRKASKFDMYGPADEGEEDETLDEANESGHHMDEDLANWSASPSTPISAPVTTGTPTRACAPRPDLHPEDSEIFA